MISAGCDCGSDHPREYGENTEIPPETMATAWIIPANTGRMIVHSAASNGKTDHPREYGENAVSAGSKLADQGSSPRIRGESCPGPVG